LLALLTKKTAKLLGIEASVLRKGGVADLCLRTSHKTWPDSSPKMGYSIRRSWPVAQIFKYNRYNFNARPAITVRRAVILTNPFQI